MMYNQIFVVRLISHTSTLLFYLTYLLRLDCFEKDLEESISLFAQFGSSQIHYPLNTKAIYTAVIKQDIETAIHILSESLSYDIEPFSQISIFTNMSTCYLKLGELEQARLWIEKADKLIEKAGNDDVILLLVYHYVNWAMYFKSAGQTTKALEQLLECERRCKLHPRHQYVVYQQQVILSKMLGIEISENLQKNSQISSYPILTRYIEQDMFFATIRFYE